VEEQNTFLGGKDFCICYILKINYSDNNKIWGDTKTFGRHCPGMPFPRGYEPGLYHHSGSRLQIPECGIASLLLVNWKKGTSPSHFLRNPTFGVISTTE